MARRLRRAIRAQLHLQVVRDRINRLRFGDRAPISGMAVYPRPRSITHGHDSKNAGVRLRRRHSGMVKGGDWDLYQVDLSKTPKLVSCRMRWLGGADWEETPIFQQMLAQIEQGLAPDECYSKADLLSRYRKLDKIFEETKARGRMLGMEELPDYYYRRAHGATLVHVARDGTCLRSGGGAHRFAIASILDLPEMPAQLGVVHPKAIEDGHLDRLRMSKLKPTAN